METIEVQTEPTKQQLLDELETMSERAVRKLFALRGYMIHEDNRSPHEILRAMIEERFESECARDEIEV